MRMHLTSRFVAVLFCSSFLMLAAAFGQKATIEADIKGVDGRPSKGAEVRLERIDKKSVPLILKTDARGHLVANNLEAGTYKVTATVEGGVSSSQTVKAKANKSLVAFNMSKTAAITGKAKVRYTWVPAETGTRLGGHWVESPDTVEKGSASERNIDKMNGNQLERIQRDSLQNVSPANGGQ